MSLKLAAPQSICQTRILSTVLTDTWMQNTGIRYAISGILGNSVLYVLDRLLLPIIKKLTNAKLIVKSSRQREFQAAVMWACQNPESVTFFVAYMLDIIVQHFFNAVLVFGMETIKTRDLYLSSLTSTYSAYFVTLLGSTVFQAYLLKYGIPKNVAFWGTIVSGSAVNFVVLTALNTRSKPSSGPKRD